MIDPDSKLSSYQAALDAFVSRIQEDRWILAAVLVGSLLKETIIQKEHLYLWIIESDGVSLRKKSDGEDVRIWRTMVENDVNIWAEIIPRSRFKKMVEGASRTAFSYNFFAKRELVYSKDESIGKWFEDANTLAQRDQKNDLFISTTWVIHGLRRLRKLLDLEKDLERAWQSAIDVAHSLAGVHIVESGEICETPAIHRAHALNPELFNVAYSALLASGPRGPAIRKALETGEEWLIKYGSQYMTPVLSILKKQPRVMGLSELANHYVYSQIYPWHIESACEWLVEMNILEKLASEMPLTKKSRIQLEEPAYLYNGTD